MESKQRRRIKDGKEFDHLFPPPGGDDITIKKLADVADTVKLIQRTVPQTLWQTEKIAKRLKGRNLDETCSNIWHFVYGHIQYKRDKDGVEQVRSPRRTWRERDTGVDCDCYTEFISSILLNLNIPHKLRITKYPKRPPDEPRWQHIYPIVPNDSGTCEYITVDCVKDNYDDEQPFLECKDYDMQLDYLDGFDDTDSYEEEEEEYVFDTVDAQGLADLYDGDELGILKKLRKGIKKAAKKVGTAVKKTVKKVGDAAGKGIRFLNRFANPATILLRNGFLLAMKKNMLNVGKRIRYAYLTDAEAQAKGINLSELKKLRKVKDKAETVYWQAGGKKENLKKAILGGRGNRDKKIALKGLYGTDDDNVYADQDEYNIIHSMDGIDGLGEVATGAALAAATGAVAAISAALKQVKGLFSKDSQAEQEFSSDKDSDDNVITSLINKVAPVVNSVKSATTTVKTTVEQAKSLLPQSSAANDEIIEDEPTIPVPYAPPASSSPSPAQSANESAPDAARTIPSPQEPLPIPPEKSVQPVVAEENFFKKATTWVKENPGTTLLIAGGAVGGFMAFKAWSGGSRNNVSGLNGVSTRRKKRRKAKSKTRHGKIKIQPITF